MRLAGRGHYSELNSFQLAELMAEYADPDLAGADPAKVAEAQSQISPYAVTQFAGAMALAVSMQAANSLEAGRVADELSSLSLQEFYGNISFNNQQITTPMLGLQLAPSNASAQVVFPRQALGETVDYYFPTPTWPQRAEQNDQTYTGESAAVMARAQRMAPAPATAVTLERTALLYFPSS